MLQILKGHQKGRTVDKYVQIPKKENNNKNDYLTCIVGKVS